MNRHACFSFFVVIVVVVVVVGVVIVVVVVVVVVVIIVVVIVVVVVVAFVVVIGSSLNTDRDLWGRCVDVLAHKCFYGDRKCWFNEQRIF